MPRVDLAIALDDGMLIIIVVLYDEVVYWVRSAGGVLCSFLLLI